MARTGTTTATPACSMNGSGPIGRRATDLAATAPQAIVLKENVPKAIANKVLKETANKAIASKAIAPKEIGARVLPERNAAGSARSAGFAKSRIEPTNSRTLPF
jgi:hypothetical protein